MRYNFETNIFTLLYALNLKCNNETDVLKMDFRDLPSGLHHIYRLFFTFIVYNLVFILLRNMNIA